MLILINGASSSGKTSLARSLQRLWSGPLLYWSLDQVISQLPFSYTGTGEYSTTGFEAVDSDIYVRKHGYVLNDLSVAYIVSLANAGYDVVIDYVVIDQQVLMPFVERLHNHEVCFVGLTCDERVISDRNTSRVDRVPGLSLQQQSKVHFCRSFYDLELDSSKALPEELASQLFAFIANESISRGVS